MKADKNFNKEYMKRTTAYIFMFVSFIIGFFVATTMMNSQEVTVQKQVLGSSGESSSAMNVDNGIMQHIAQEEMAIAQNPNDGDAWGHLGNLYYQTDQYSKAVTAYERAIEIFPNNVNYMTDLGTMYRALKEYDKALATYDKVLTINPEHQNARFNRGIVLLFDLKREEEALNNWKILIKKYPDTKVPDGRLLSDFIKEIEQN